MRPITAAGFALVLGSALGALPAGAQGAAPNAPDQGDGRYSFHRVQDSVLRLDGRTGAVATCASGAAGWTCQASPDERAALEAEIGRLQADNAALKREWLARGLTLPDGAASPGATSPAPPTPPVARAPDKIPDALKPPTEAELEKVKTFIGDVWKRVVDLVATLQRDWQR